MKENVTGLEQLKRVSRTKGQHSHVTDRSSRVTETAEVRNRKASRPKGRNVARKRVSMTSLKSRCLLGFNGRSIQQTESAR